jgi:peptidyl-prolyl cis-trans isomerase D
MFKKLIKSQTARRRVSWLIAAVLIVPFVLFFHATGQSPVRGPGGTAGILFGKPVSWETFEEQHLWLRRRFENQLGEIPEFLEQRLPQEAWQRLMLLEEAKRRRLRVEERELAVFIRQQPVFQDNGRFSAERYHLILRASGTTPQTFERMVRSDLLVDKLLAEVRSSVTLTDEEVREAYRRSRERVKTSLLLIEPSAFRDQASAAVTEEEVRAYYDAHTEEFRLPEEIALEVAGASAEELAGQVRLTEEDLSAFHRGHQEQFAAEDGTLKPLEEVREAVRRQAAEQRVRRQLTALALDLEADVAANVLFEEIVKTRALAARSIGPVPLSGLQSSGELDPEVIKAVERLTEGRMSGVIETPRGVHVARVTRRVPSRAQPFTDARDAARDRIVQQRSREAARGAADAAHARIKEQGAGDALLQEAGLAPGVRLLSPSPFTRTEPIELLGQVPAVNEAAFATPVGGLSEVLETPQGFMMVRPEERFPADESGFADAEAAVREEALRQRQAEELADWFADLRSRAKLQSFVDQGQLNSGA